MVDLMDYSKAEMMAVKKGTLMAEKMVEQMVDSMVVQTDLKRAGHLVPVMAGLMVQLKAYYLADMTEIKLVD